MSRDTARVPTNQSFRNLKRKAYEIYYIVIASVHVIIIKWNSSTRMDYKVKPINKLNDRKLLAVIRNQFPILQTHLQMSSHVQRAHIILNILIMCDSI